MGIFKCDMPGCKKSSLRKHTHVTGDMSRTSADWAQIENARWFAQMRGEPIHIPGGSMADMNRYLKQQEKEGLKAAKKYRQELSRELDEQRKRGEKQDKTKAEKAVKKKFGWK